MSETATPVSQKDFPNILKTRDDTKPVSFTLAEGIPEKAIPYFNLSKDSQCNWAKKDDPIEISKLRARIEPWLTALCQSDHLSILLGSGLSAAVHTLAVGKPPLGMSKASFEVCGAEIDSEAKKTANLFGRKDGNIEDQIRIAHELLKGLQILGVTSEDHKRAAERLYAELNKVLEGFANSILDTERKLILANEGKREKAFNYLVSFLMTFASRTGTRERLHIFTTNYDRIVEAGAEVAGMHLLDRFVGSLAPIFRSSRLDLDMHYNPPGIRGEPRYLEGVARYTKLHGSVDWVDCGENIRRAAIPFGVTDLKPYLAAPGLSEAEALRIMIYPNSAKDQETAFFPYVEMFRDFAASICRPSHTLITYGYGFGDEHINRIIEDMLTIPSTHLVVISFSDPLGRIIKIYDKIGRQAQVSLLLGDHLGDMESLVDHYLPKPAIDRTTFRMADLLKSRWGTRDKHDSDMPEPPVVEGIEPK